MKLNKSNPTITSHSAELLRAGAMDLVLDKEDMVRFISRVLIAVESTRVEFTLRFRRFKPLPEDTGFGSDGIW